MTMLIDQAIGLSVVLSAVLAASIALRRRSAALRHWVLAAGILSSLALPLARPLVPRWGAVALPASIHASAVTIANPAATARAAGEVARAEATAPATRARGSLAAALVRAWAAGAVGGFFVLVAGIGRLAWHARHARVLHTGPWKRAAGRIGAEMGLRRTVSVLETSSASMLGAWGWRSPRVLLPRAAHSWPEQDVDLVMRHELAHIARGDWAIQIFAEALRALYWFNPLTWIACARLRLESERACDDEVLRAGVRGDDYALCLVRLATVLRSAARRWAPYPAPGMARSTTLQRRVSAMLEPHLIRTSVTAPSRAVIAVLAVALTFVVAGLVVRAQGQERFSGSVLDPSGKNMANVHIALTEQQTKARRDIRSDDRGRFDLAGLAPGEYEMEVSIPGFATLKGTVTVVPGGVTQDIKLQLGSVQETITVAGKPQATPAARAARPSGRRIESPAPQPPACVETAMGGDVRPPTKLVDVKPDYPEALLAAKLGGVVVLEGILAADGTIRDLRVVETAPPELVRSAMEAVGKWRFTPTLLNCEPADIKIKVNVKFVAE
jgi:TonB family protein